MCPCVCACMCAWLLHKCPCMCACGRIVCARVSVHTHVHVCMWAHRMCMLCCMRLCLSPAASVAGAFLCPTSCAQRPIQKAWRVLRPASPVCVLRPAMPSKKLGAVERKILAHIEAQHGGSGDVELEDAVDPCDYLTQRFASAPADFAAL